MFSFGSSLRIRRLSLAALLLASSHLGAAGSAARADEFSLVPPGNPLYKHFAIVRRAGWNEQGARAETSPSTTSLTRYEMALETARAYLSVSMRARASNGAATGATALSVSRPALRSLRELIVALRAELRSLDIDVTQALSFCDRILQRDLNTPPASSVASAERASSESPTTSSPAPLRPQDSGLQASAPTFGARGARRDWQPLSQKLRLQAAFSSLEREAGDPFGDAAARSSYRPAEGTSRTRLRSAFLLGGAYEVTDWLHVRADYARRPLAGAINSRAMLASNPASEPLSPLLMRSYGQAGEGRSVGGGVDIALIGLTLSGQVAHLSTNGADATRFGGGVALNAWQNRLSLSANLSRLVPEDSPKLSSTAAGFNVDVSVTERLRLKLLYQQLFNSPTQNRGERLVAGGINISF